VPLQDVLALGGEHRMNQPGVANGCWRWRFQWNQVEPEVAGRYRHWLELYGRV
jgi:4-alpha-glucanotransferase